MNDDLKALMTTREAPRTHDYFAELYVAGRLAEAGWNIYFPHRDQGFDFIITSGWGNLVIRPVQVKGKYPTEGKTDKPVYGYTGKLSAMHPEMVLAIPYFSSKHVAEPVCVAYMPRSLIIPGSKGWRCHPATYKGGAPKPRRDFAKFFDADGIESLEQVDWANSSIDTA